MKGSTEMISDELDRLAKEDADRRAEEQAIEQDRIEAQLLDDSRDRNPEEES